MSTLKETKPFEGRDLTEIIQAGQIWNIIVQVINFKQTVVSFLANEQRLDFFVNLFNEVVSYLLAKLRFWI